MSDIKQVDKLIKKAKNNHDKMEKASVPGLQYLEIEGVDYIPVGGHSEANKQEKDRS